MYFSLPILASKLTPQNFEFLLGLRCAAVLFQSHVSHDRLYFSGVLALHLLATCCGLFDFSNLNIDDETETEKGDGRGLHDVLLDNNADQDVESYAGPSEQWPPIPKNKADTIWR